MRCLLGLSRLREWLANQGRNRIIVEDEAEKYKTLCLVFGGRIGNPSGHSDGLPIRPTNQK